MCLPCRDLQASAVYHFPPSYQKACHKNYSRISRLQKQWKRSCKCIQCSTASLHMISINVGVGVWITGQMDWFMKAAVTHWWSLFWACPTWPISCWLTVRLNDWLNDNQFEVIKSHLPLLPPFFHSFRCSSVFSRSGLFTFSREEEKKNLFSCQNSLMGKSDQQGKEVNGYPWWHAVPFSFYFFVPFCAFTLAFCISCW